MRSIRFARNASALAAACCLVAGCQMGAGLPQQIRSRPAADRRYPPRPANYPISVFQGDVQEAYEVLGTVQSRSYRESEVDASGEADLRQGAREMGGDAVIHVARKPKLTEELGYSPGSLTRAGAHFATQYVLSGTVIRYAGPAAQAAPASSGAQSAPPGASVSLDLSPLAPPAAPEP